MNQKAIRAGEIRPDDMASLDALGYAPATDNIWLDDMPEEARALILASEDLYYRVQRVSEGMMRSPADVPAPLAMIERIRASF